MRDIRWLRRLLTMVLTCAAGIAPAQNAGWKPSRTVEIIVQSAAGGSSDRSARVTQKILQGIAGFPSVSVNNKPGAANTIGWAYLNQHAGDAHYIATISPVLIGNKLMGTSPLTYTHFTPLNILAREFVVLAVRADSPIKTLADLTARMKKDPQSLSWAFATARLLSAAFLKQLEVEQEQTRAILTDLGLIAPRR